MQNNESVMSVRHPDYDATIDAVLTVRDCIEGSNAIKNGDRADEYLPNPSDSTPRGAQEISEAAATYNKYKMRAEYDGFPERTESGLLGSLNSAPPVFDDFPAEIDYLIDDSDGNNLPLSEAVEIIQSNLLAVKFHGLLADFNGVDQLDSEGNVRQLTAGESQALGFKATIKHYPRESIIDWDYGLVNGKNQLRYIKVAESKSSIDPQTLRRTLMHNQLVLALDEDGFYYQQLIESTEKEEVVGERIYPQMHNKKMDFIPFNFCVDQKNKSASVPKQLGILYPICLKALSRYQVSADLKESMHLQAQPQRHTSGWDQQKFSLYEEMNKEGHKTGSSNIQNYPDGVTLGLLQYNVEGDAMFEYLRENEKQVRALGGQFDTSEADNQAVGIAKLRSEETLSALTNIQTSAEASLTQVSIWCYWYMSDKTDEPELNISLNKEFNKIKLTAQEQQAIANNLMQGVIDHEEALRQLEQGGVLTTDAETLLNRMNFGGGDVND